MFKSLFKITLVLVGLSLFSFKLRSQERIITTGVPFLLITPNARAAGMGDQGVATSADVFSQQWNPSKYIFSENKSEIGVSYTPYLSKLIDDIFLANITYYSKNTKRNAWGASFKYFSLGDVVLNNLVAGNIIEQGVERPNELTLDFSYSILLSSKYSMSVAARLIHSDLKISSDSDATSASTFGIDISGFYKSNLFDIGSKEGRLRIGFNISNIGPRLSYDAGGRKSFIPTNLKVGSGLNIHLDSSNKISFNLELNKLLVPSPIPVLDEKTGELLNYEQPDISFFTGIFKSFSDALGGFSEELKEVTWALGSEYIFQDRFALRTGYFNEHAEKGSRKYFTLGTGFLLNPIEMNVSYLFSNSKVRNPLENTLRFSFIYNFGGGSLSLPNQEGVVLEQ